MRRIGILVFLALSVVGLGGSATPAIARTPLSVLASCYNHGGWNFACGAWATGGTGSYPTYSWTAVYQYGWSPQTYTYTWDTSSWFWTNPCSEGDRMTVTMTVTDSGGATASANTQTIYCSQWAD